MDQDYKIGYRKPPQDRQFKTGESGNRQGRPKGTKNLKTDLVEEMREKVVIREGERSRTISKQRAIVKALVARTLKGDARAANTLLNVHLRLLDPEAGVAVADEPLNTEEREVLQSLKAHILGDAQPQIVAVSLDLAKDES